MTKTGEWNVEAVSGQMLSICSDTVFTPDVTLRLQISADVRHSELKRKGMIINRSKSTVINFKKLRDYQRNKFWVLGCSELKAMII